MQDFFVNELGFSVEVFSFILLPVLIFLARILDVSINTIRIIYVLGGRRLTATMLGFFESFIWLMAIRQIFEHMDNWICYVAYPAGFASGIFIGMIIEERIAYGKVIVRIITSKDVKQLISYLNEQNFRYTLVNAEGPNGPEHLLFTVLERERLEDLLTQLKNNLPTAFFTVEKVNRAIDGVSGINEPRKNTISSWLRSIRRE